MWEIKDNITVELRNIIVVKLKSGLDFSIIAFSGSV